jgi:uncharacterized membrane protein YoaK (UPF0700 family)
MMEERVVDRAAAQATPTELAVRDWLLAGLSFSAGMYEAICFLALGKVFAGFQTGNLVFLGFGVAGTHAPAGPNAVTVVISLAAFAAGVTLAVPILKASSGAFQVWPRPVSIALGIALIPQVAFLAVWATTASPATLAYVLIALAAFAMGLQANAIRSLNVPNISTTAFTATFVGLVSGVVTWSLTAPTARRLIAVVVGVAAGGFLGDWMLSHAHTYAPVVPAVVTAVVITVSQVALKSPGSRPSGGWSRGSTISIVSRPAPTWPRTLPVQSPLLLDCCSHSASWPGSGRTRPPSTAELAGLSSMTTMTCPCGTPEMREPADASCGASRVTDSCG